MLDRTTSESQRPQLVPGDERILLGRHDRDEAIQMNE